MVQHSLLIMAQPIYWLLIIDGAGTACLLAPCYGWFSTVILIMVQHVYWLQLLMVQHSHTYYGMSLAPYY